MQAGDVLGDRFELGRVAGSGGMAIVYQALDRSTGEQVAVKLLVEGSEQDQARFEREAQTIADLRHPRIVRYVAHGLAAPGDPYLAMEWLEGEDLHRRLQRQPVTVAESLTLASSVADALAAAHARGVIHRDLKPSNLFLVGGRIADVKVLDFGVAQLGGVSRMTETGMLLGTPGYMAPEQARGWESITVSVDVFSLGCVLFECLTGVPAFTGKNVMALLAKVLFDDPPRVIDLRPEIPADLDALVLRMLAKNPAARPPDGAALLQDLSAIGTVGGDERPVAGHVVPSLTGVERRILSVVLIGKDPSLASATASSEATVRRDHLQEVAEARGGQFECLADGSMMVIITGSRVATDQAIQAARCALSMRAFVGERPMALATGRAEVTGRLPVGDVIDRAAKMISILAKAGQQQRSELDDDEESPGRVTLIELTTAVPIAIDDVTAGLLDATFDVARGDAGLELRGEHPFMEGTRTLLGKPTACVGRDRESAMLKALYTECIDEPMASAVLLTAPAGMGKSRLAHEFIRWVRQRGDPVEIWTGRGNSLQAGSAFGMLRQALRGACGMLAGERLSVRHDKLRARLSRRLPAADQNRVTEFLGELLAAPLPDDDSPLLRAARQDAQIMGGQVRRAWEDFLRAECAAQPVLLVLEDLHWGDLPTVQFVDSALRSLKKLPLMVLAMARPQVHEMFPKLWAERDLHEVRLNALPRKASERLVRQVLGDAVAPETVDRLVRQADGHAFYLEEVIRAYAEGKGDALPETVLAMVQVRLEGLDGEARRVLRAASVFGEVFWPGGVAALLGGGPRSLRAKDWLQTLVEEEVLMLRPDSRFTGEAELAFRHALLREGAYAMLTEKDRALGHRLAAEWLQEAGENDPIVLAEHFERAGDPERAGTFYLHAAEEAIVGLDVNGAMARARRGLECGVADALRIRILGLLSEAHVWRSEWSLAASYAEQVMQMAAPGSVPWARAAIGTQGNAMREGDMAKLMATLNHVRLADPSPDAVGFLAHALTAGIFWLDSAGQFATAEIFVDRLHAIVAPVAQHDPFARGWMNMAHTFREEWVHEDPWTGLCHSEAAHLSFREAGQQGAAWGAQVFIGMNALSLGDFVRAEREFLATMEAGEELAQAAPLRTFHMVEVLAARGAIDEAEREANHLIEAGRARHIIPDEGRGRLALASILFRNAKLSAAEQEVLPALDLLGVAPLDHAAAVATLAAIRLAQGRAREALAASQQAMSEYERLGTFGHKGAYARVVHAEALFANGDREGARTAITIARDRLLINAERIGHPAMRRSFLEKVPENARTFYLAQEWPGRKG
jgi:tetratricopeptide (TPR) repeat protein